MSNWRQLITQYEDGKMVLLELKWRLFASFATPEDVKDFLEQAPAAYKQYVAQAEAKCPHDDAGWSKMVVLGSGMTAEQAYKQLRQTRAGVETYRRAASDGACRTLPRDPRQPRR